jgi:hypothetical protein
MARKKTKKRLRKLAKVLGAGLAIAGLGRAFANRNKASAADVDSGRGSGLRPTVDDVEFKESIVSTPVQDVEVNVPKTNNTIFRTRNRITDSAGNTIPSGKGDYVQRAKDAAAADAMRAFRSDRAYRGDMMTAQSNTPQNFKTSEYDYFSKGGRVKKRTGAAKRGFGRAFKGGKK